jgi:photosystem II stability/assembly factor-like uncharacterized protein
MKLLLHTSRIIICFMTLFYISPSFAQKLDMEKLKGMKPRSIGPAGMSGRITAIDVVVSNPDIIYAGAASGGVWKSTSGGITWEPLFDKESVLSVGAIAIQQDNPSVVWVGTGEGNPRNSLNGGYGIYKSLDGGKTWKVMGLEKTRNIHRIAIDPKNSNTIYVGAIGSPWGEHPERGVFKTTDGGITWEKILFVDNKTGCADLQMDPSNPNKLIASMWEHRRWPWTFKSGGPGSGIYITLDGGKKWKKLTEKEGLPEGELGRVGLAIARNKPDIIYALIESKKNALYRSDDGGAKWNMVTEVNGKNNVNARPFYFWEIYVDPKNENRIYSLHTFITKSEDGGKSFQLAVGWKVHLDHHAFWIHPENPNFIVDGNDGGVNISHDMGKSWQFADNIPVGQFYHINVDMAHPFNVYGGMQDNGSWAGPSYVWRNSGIRNSYFQEVAFGDGFDVVPDPDDNRYGYAMSQEGYLRRYDIQTGQADNLRPTHPDMNVKLRYNWNSGLAQDPFNSSTIYYGSQFLHKSTDKGATWEIISPDLTTNDPEKQKQSESGGITMDATGAENHCTIIAVAVSPKQQGVIWVGTDDGRVQLTKDGGKTWNDVAPKIAGMPKAAWVPQLQASTHNAGEAFVVVNNYRQFDFKPYLFRTKDFGMTWESLVSSAQVGENNYTLAVVQDPVESKLLFLGTENGLWVSLDEGKNWTRWTADYPAGVPTMDMVIHPREHDLAIATFGRAFYILDDIRPLREMVKSGSQLLDKQVHLFAPPVAYITETQQPTGPRFDADAVFNGQNRPYGALISYAVNKPKAKAEETTVAKVNDPKKSGSTKPLEVKSDEKKEESKIKYDSITLDIFNSGGKLIRTIKQKASEDNGLNRMTWALNEKGFRNPSREQPAANASELAGINVLPGVYKLRITFGDKKDSTNITVKDDPRLNTPANIVEARYKMLSDLDKLTAVVSSATDRLRESKEVAEELENKMKAAKRDDLKEALEKTKAVKDSINAVFDFILGKEDKRQGILFDYITPVAYIGKAGSYIGSSRKPVNATDQRVYKQAEDQVGLILERVNKFYGTTWLSYRNALEKVSISPFKNYEPLKR